MKKVRKKLMKKEKILYICVLFLLIIFTACTKGDGAENVNDNSVTIAPDELDKIKPDQINSWAAIYDKDKEILSFAKDGSAVYKDVSYKSYKIDDNFITFEGKDEMKCRYQMKRKKMLLYETKEYKKENVGDAYSDVAEDSVVGLWSFDENVSFEFTKKGTFYEDRNFPGHYSVDEDAHSIKLMYNDHFEDIYLYYTIEGDVMKIEYPWSLVPTGSKEE